MHFTLCATLIRRQSCAPLLLLVAALASSACYDGDVTTPGTATRFVDVSAGAQHSCALDADGVAWCWGRATEGRLGGRAAQSCSGETCPSPILVLRHRFTEIDAGGAHTCALDAFGAAYCWGLAWRGQLGDAFTLNQFCGPLSCSPIPHGVAIGFPLKLISAGAEHTCAVSTDDRPWCWGYGHFSQIGFAIIGDSTGTPGLVDGDHRFTAISAGTSHTCAIAREFAAFCWGADLEGRLGRNFVESSSVPVPVTGDPRNEDPAKRVGLDFARIDAGVAHNCAITVDGLAYCWGRGDGGRLGDGWDLAWPFPVNAPMPGPVVDISAGDTHSCAATASGAAYCWGLNSEGQIGDGTFESRATPTRVAIAENVVAISAGDRHTCAVTESGDLYCWGANEYAQAGAADRQPRPLPRLVGS